MTNKRRNVTIRLSVDMVKDFPAEWDEHQIEFFLNESSWCTGNLLDQLDREIERAEKWGCCGICSRASVQILREATEEDLEFLTNSNYPELEEDNANG